MSAVTTKNIKDLNNPQVMGWADCPISRVAAKQMQIGASLDINSGTPIGGTPALQINQTWNDAGTIHSAITAKVTNVASNNNSTIISLMSNNTLRFSVRHDGRVIHTNDTQLGKIMYLGYLADSLTGVGVLGFGSGDKVKIISPSAGILTLLNNTSTDFNRLQFGGLTSAYPALQRSAQTLQVLLADGSNWASIQGKITTHSNASIGTIIGDKTLTIYDASGTAYRVNVKAA